MIASAIVVAYGWSNIQAIFKAKLAVMKELLSFGKYTMGTLISTNLLKSADTFMISWYLGPASLAAYNLPYKLIELVEIPLRSLAATFLPQALKQNDKSSLSAIRYLFYQYTGVLTFLLLPLAVVMFFFAEELVVILGGEAYATSANIFRCFVIYSLFLPLDRFLGITLDILNKPQLNLLKVCLMVGINIAGNLVAIHFFSSLLFIAVATIITIFCGTVIGWVVLGRILHIQISELMDIVYLTIEQRINKQAKSSAA